MIDFMKFDQDALRKAMGIAAPHALEPPSQGMINAERKRIVRQILSRKFEGINLYKALPISEQFHACNAEKRIVTGSNRCLAGCQEIYDPVAKSYRKVSEIDSDFHVYSVNPDTGCREIRRACKPFVKGIGTLYRFTLSNGQTLSATKEHHVVDAGGRWISFSNAIGGHPLAVCHEISSHHKIPLNLLQEQDQESSFVTSHPPLFVGINSSSNCTLLSYESLGVGEIWDFTVEPYANYVAGGLINANSSKTFSVSAEATRAWLACDPYNKFRPSNGNSIFVGLDLDHCAMFWRKCSQPGQFKIIPDEHTGMWRAVRPDPNNPLQLDPYDIAYSDRWKDAPPLISNRNIKTIAWEDRGKGIPRYVTFKTNWRCLFRSSDGKAAQGDAFDLAIFDEEQSSLEWYYEIVRGLVGQHVQTGWHPKLIWSATSQVANIELANLRDRAAVSDPGVMQFDMLLRDNPYFTEQAKAEFEASLPENERLTRIEGIPAMTVRRIYPTYSPMVDVEDGGHGCEPFEVDPAKYCRYAIIDPGISHCTTLFVLVDDQEKHVTVYDGFQLSSATANKWAVEMKLRENGRQFEAMVIDARMGEQSPMVQHKTTVAQEYWKSLQEVDCIPRQRGPFYGFYPSNNNIEARCECLRSWMEIRGDGPFAGTPVLRVMRGQVPKLDREIRMAATDPKNDKKRMKLAKVPCDHIDALEYAAAFKPRYHSPGKVIVDDESEALVKYKAWKTNHERREARETTGVSMYR